MRGPRPIPWIESVIAIALSTNACGGAPRAVTTSTSSAPSEAAIVLLRVAKGNGHAFESVWVEPDASGANVRARRAEPVVAAEDGLWAFRTTLDRTHGCPACDCEEGAKTCPTVPLELTHARAVRLGVDEVLAIADPQPEPCQEDGVHEATYDVTLVGAVGSVLFVDESSMTMACLAAHPFYTDDAWAFDLERRARIDVAPAELAPLAARARADLVAQHSDCLMDPDEEPTLFASTFAYDARGTLRGTYEFTMSAPYVCGTGPGHYSVLADVEDAQLPPTMTRFRSLPSWLVAWMRGREVVGVGVLPARLDAAAAFAAFRER